MQHALHQGLEACRHRPFAQIQGGSFNFLDVYASRARQDESTPDDLEYQAPLCYHSTICCLELWLDSGVIYHQEKAKLRVAADIMQVIHICVYIAHSL